MDNINDTTSSRATRSNSTSSTDSSKIKTNDKPDPSKSVNSIDRVCAMINKLQQTVEKNNKASNDKFSLLEGKISTLTDVWKSELNSMFSNHLKKCDTNYNSLSSKVTSMENLIVDKLEYMDRKNRQSEIIIRGIPANDNENLYALYNKLASVLKFPYEMAYVLSSIFRLNNKSSSASSAGIHQQPPILLKFTTPYLKQSFFKQYIQFNHLKLKDIGIDSNNRIFISDNLTKKNSLLYKKAMDMKTANIIDKIHVRNGLVQVKYNGSSKFNVIQCENDLLAGIQHTPHLPSQPPSVDLNSTIVENEI